MNDAKQKACDILQHVYIGYAAEVRHAVRPTSKLLKGTVEARRDSREETSMLSRAAPAPVRSR